MKAILKYPGSKWAVAKWIVGHFPDHHSYLEPFFGSGAVLFAKPPSAIETINDVDGDVVNLFRWIRDNPDALAHAVRWTPYARDVYNQAWKRLPTETDSFQRALDFYARCMMGYGFKTGNGKTGFKVDVQGRESAYACRHWEETPEAIMAAASRLRRVQIENRDALSLIGRFNFRDVLIYADPPYLMSTRYGKQYRYEMDEYDHKLLLRALKAHRGPVVLSGYDSELYNQELAGWHRDEIQTLAQTGDHRVEVVWMNFEPPNKQERLY